MRRKVKHLFLLIFGFICLNLAVKIFHSIKVTKQRSFLVFRDILFEDRAIINTEKINLLCIVLTSPTSVFERVGSLYETWAKKCNKTIFACNFNSNSNSSHVNVTKENLNLIKSLEFLNLTKQESYDRMAEKVMNTIKLSYDMYGQNHNWFLLVDDDTFIFYDNLIKFIKTKSSKRAFTYGYNFKSVVSTGYQSGIR
jgi:glycoprotein-N-acetylgalactosamine 3-beta-galactosyltransferase